MVDLAFLDDVQLAELHTHLGFSVSPTMLWEIAHDQGLKLPTKSYFEFEKMVTFSESKGYEDYIKTYDMMEKIQSSPEALFAATQYAASSAFRKNHITVLELRFNPILRNRQGERDLDHLIVFALQGMERAMLKYPIKVGIILMMDRRFTAEENEAIVTKAIKYKSRGVVGVDLAGPIERTAQSKRFRPRDIVGAVDRARQAGLGITVHTGEVTNVDEMWEALESLKPDRVAHGIACVNDESMMAYLKKNKIPLDVCPTSNLNTKALKNFDDMKRVYRSIFDYGIPMTINTDGPEMQGISLRHEYGMLVEQEIFTRQELLQLNQIAHQVTFIQ